MIIVAATAGGCTQGNNNRSFTTETTLYEGASFRIGNSDDFGVDILTFYGVTIEENNNQKAILQTKNGHKIVGQKEIGIGNSMEVIVRDGSRTLKKKITIKEIKRVKTDEKEKFAVKIRIEPIT